MIKVKKLMIVDDSLLDIHLVERTLEINDFGGQIVIADTISDAVSEMAKWLTNGQPLPDLILLDMFYPKETAMDFLNYFEGIDEHLQKTVKIAVISATKPLFDQDEMLKRPGVVRILDKPFSYNQISDLI